MKKKVFFSYSFRDCLTIEYYYSMLSKYAKEDMDIFFYDRIYHEQYWGDMLKTALSEIEYFVFFMGKEIGNTQKKELEYWNSLKEPNDHKHSILVIIEDPRKYSANEPEGFKPVLYRENSEGEFDKFRSFKELYFKLQGIEFRFHDGLPTNSQLFNYEKDIINFYQNKYIIGKSLLGLTEKTKTYTNSREIKKIEEILNQGIIPDWPEVKINYRIERAGEGEFRYEKIKNPILSEIGSPRKAHVLAAALTNYHEVESGSLDKPESYHCDNFCLKEMAFSFPEAGPREFIYKPIIPITQHYNVAILVTGGIAPGINAVIDGITQRHYKYAKSSKYEHQLQVIGFKNGFKSFQDESNIVFLYPNKQLSKGKENEIVTSEMISVGGCMIGTSRWEELETEGKDRHDILRDIIHTLRRLNINILYIIGGEGSMKAAHALYTYYDNRFPQTDDWRLNIVGIPKTMDNDILWVWQTFGFMSAVEKAREFIDYLAVETSSNPRVGIVQLFGSNSGFVVSHAVLASRTGVCDFALIPESPYKLEKLIPGLKKTLEDKRKNYGLIIMSETAIPTDALEYLKKYGKDICLTEPETIAIKKYFNDNQIIKGHIDDKLREASFKIVKYSIEKEIDFKVLTNEPRHLIRSIPPSTIDIINANRLGTLAVDNAIAGYTDCMISQWLTEYCLVPLDLVVLGRKRIPKDGIFWRSVVAKTGQPEKLD